MKPLTRKELPLSPSDTRTCHPVRRPDGWTLFAEFVEWTSADIGLLREIATWLETANGVAPKPTGPGSHLRVLALYSDALSIISHAPCNEQNAWLIGKAAEALGKTGAASRGEIYAQIQDSPSAIDEARQIPDALSEPCDTTIQRICDEDGAADEPHECGARCEIDRSMMFRLRRDIRGYRARIRELREALAYVWDGEPSPIDEVSQLMKVIELADEAVRVATFHGDTFEYYNEYQSARNALGITRGEGGK
jgi:hypothetical protein